MKIKQINKEIEQYRKYRKEVEGIFDTKMKDKKFKKTYDKVAQGLKEAEKGIDMTTVGKGKTYETLDDMFRAMDKERTILDYIRMYWNRYFWNFVSDIPLRVKTFIQRGMRGWADSDTWCLDYYIAKVVSEGIEHLIKNGNSCWTKKDLKAIRIIQKTFETIISIEEDHTRYIPSEKFTWKEYKKAKRYYKTMSDKYEGRYHVMTLREAKRFELGFELFKKYYFYLWD